MKGITRRRTREGERKGGKRADSKSVVLIEFSSFFWHSLPLCRYAYRRTLIRHTEMHT
jgi:hypothetical protein